MQVFFIDPFSSISLDAVAHRWVTHQWSSTISIAVEIVVDHRNLGISPCRCQGQSSVWKLGSFLSRVNSFTVTEKAIIVDCAPPLRALSQYPDQLIASNHWNVCAHLQLILQIRPSVSHSHESETKESLEFQGNFYKANRTFRPSESPKNATRSSLILSKIWQRSFVTGSRFDNRQGWPKHHQTEKSGKPFCTFVDLFP